MANQSFQEKIARKFPPDFRKEIMPRIMEAITKGESCFIVGVSGTGKSNLFRFIKSQEAREKYLAHRSEPFAFIWADTNALTEDLSAFGLYELILYNLLKWVEETEPPDVSVDHLRAMHEKVVLSENRTLAQRHLETALRHLFHKIEGLHIVLLFDEFEPIAQDLDFQFFRSLRWLRDEFKYRLVYLMAAHRAPTDIRSEMFDRGEPLYELLAPNILGLRFYNAADTEFMISELSERYQTEMSDSKREMIFRLSGGHGGLISAIFKMLFKESLPHDESWQIEKLLSYDAVAGECRKIWNSLEVDEQDTIILLMNQNMKPQTALPLSSLISKGVVIKDGAGNIAFFSTLFAASLRQLLEDMLVDEDAAGGVDRR